MSRGRFHLAEDIQGASFARSVPSFAARNGNGKGRRAEGLRYERAVQRQLCLLSEWYLPSPWLLYISGGKACWCQPDGIHFDLPRGRITIVEIKLSHTPDAHRQLRGVYEPVLRRMFPEALWRLHLVEICRWFDPDVSFPERPAMIDAPFEYGGSAIGVHILRP